MNPAPVLIYVQYFAFAPKTSTQALAKSHRNADSPSKLTEPGINMYRLQRHKRSDGSIKGDIFPVSTIWQAVQLVPEFGKKADRRLTTNNVMDRPQYWYLNSFSDKEIYKSVY